MAHTSVIAIDLGNSSGRVMRVEFDRARDSLEMQVINRFANQPVKARGTLYWDVLSLWQGIQDGIYQARQTSDHAVASLGLDSWGVDFALLDKNGALLANPLHYRDRSTEGMIEWVSGQMPKREIFERTGIQFISISGLYRLAYLAREKSPILENAAAYLAIPNLFIYWLTGTIGCEATHTSTHQVLNAQTRDWERGLLAAVGAPAHIFPPIMQPGTRAGEYEGIPVIVPATHDTASAVVAVPTETEHYAYLSSGTWSLLGLELPAPLINDAVLEANLTNEGGYGGTTRLLKNITGLWLLQCCQSAWGMRGERVEYEQMGELAQTAEPFRSLIDPDDALFLAPDDMPEAIQTFCQRTDQPVPDTIPRVLRCVFEGLAFKYRFTLEQLISVTGRTVDVIHVIGGGSQNRALCQMTADATGREVIAGPVEATALGNAIVQLITLGELENIQQARAMLRRVTPLEHYQPQETAQWDAAYTRFKSIVTAP